MVPSAGAVPERGPELLQSPSFPSEVHDAHAENTGRDH